MKLLLGTTNPAKLTDYKKYLWHVKLELVALQDLGINEEAPETGETFEENALQKAKFYAEQTEYATLSDDGGFEVDALDRGPGVYSKRWAGSNPTDEDIIKKVFKKLEGIPEAERTARLKSVAVVYFPDLRDYVTVTRSRGGIIPEGPSKKRVKGFPYRSVLLLPEYNKFYADMSSKELEELDHRKDMCRELLLKLEPFLN